MTDLRQRGGSPRRIQSLEVGFRVIRVLAAAEGLLPLKEVAQRSRMPPSKTYTYLASFVHEGMAEQDPRTGHYRLGRLALQLGLSALRQADILCLALPELEAVRAATDCAAYLSVWGNYGPVVAVKVDGLHQGSLAVRIGYVLPLRITATGRVFLAHLPPAHWQALLEVETADPHRTVLRDPIAATTVNQDPDELAAELHAIRQAGYAVSPYWPVRGLQALAAPVFDHAGAIAGALTMLGPSVLFAGTRHGPALAALCGAADRLSAALGHPGLRSASSRLAQSTIDK